MLPDDAHITVETKKDYEDDLKDFVEDMDELKKYLR